MSRHAWPELCLIVASFAVAGTAAAQQASGNAAADAQAPQPSTTAAQPAPTEATKAATAATTASSAPPAAPPAPPAPPPGPSADLIKQARSLGFKVKGTGVQTRFCKTEAQIGTNIVTQNCMDENQFQLYLAHSEQIRNDMMRGGGCASGCAHN
jgi:hypothetical protein